MGKELEIKVQITEMQYENLKYLMDSQAAYKGKVNQKDIYYSPENINYYDEGDRCLRIRVEEDRALLSYKRIYDENTANRYIEEYEMELLNSNTMEQILKALNFRKSIVVEKERFEYLYKEHFRVAFDCVKELGYFIEIENIYSEQKDEERNTALIQVADQIGIDLSKQNFEGYSNMLYRIQNSK